MTQDELSPAQYASLAPPQNADGAEVTRLKAINNLPARRLTAWHGGARSASALALATWC
jgi:hypothetical protein